MAEMIRKFLSAFLKENQECSQNEMKQTDQGFAAWKHFQDEANAKKGELLQVTTLQLGLMGATVAFGAKEGIATSDGQIEPVILLLTGLVGVALCGLARTSVIELGEHVARSWGYADDARQGHEELNRILGAAKSPPKRAPVADHLLYLVWAFAGVFWAAVIGGAIIFFKG